MLGAGWWKGARAPSVEGRTSQGERRRRSGIQDPTSNIGLLTIYVDGASRGNPGPAGVGVLLEDEEGLRQEHLAYIGEATNNMAEYRALLLALRKAKRLKPQQVTIFSDSELLVRQLRGEYRVKNPKLQQLYRAAISLLASFPAFQIEHVGRERVRRADELANLAINRALRRRVP